MMLLFDMIVPLLMIIGGILMKRIGKVNSFVGYRTERSMKNEDTWSFANTFCARLWIKLGTFILAISIAVSAPLYFAGKAAVVICGTLLMFVQLGVLLYSIYPVEKALKKTFKDDGTRKE